MNKARSGLISHRKLHQTFAINNQNDSYIPAIGLIEGFGHTSAKAGVLNRH